MLEESSSDEEDELVPDLETQREDPPLTGINQFRDTFASSPDDDLPR